MSDGDNIVRACELERNKPVPGNNHSIIQMNFGGAWHRNPKVHRVHSEQNILLGGQKYVPDVSVYPRQPMDLRHDTVSRTEPPLLIVEIFSPGQGWQDVQPNVDAYLANGVPSVWVVMPPLSAIDVQNADGTQHTYTEGVVTDPGTGLSGQAWRRYFPDKSAAKNHRVSLKAATGSAPSGSLSDSRA